MKYLLDTHIILWAMINDKRLDSDIKNIINDSNNQIFYSTISTWEVELKHQKFKNFSLTGEQFRFLCNQNYIENIQVKDKHVKKLAEFPKMFRKLDHKDPFDRMLLAQALDENMILITHDKRFKQYSSDNILIA